MICRIGRPTELFAKISNPLRLAGPHASTCALAIGARGHFGAGPKREIYSILAHLRARISPRSWPRLHLDPKTPLSDRVLAGSNLGCQRLLKKRFFAHAQPASRCGLDSHVARRTRAPSRSPVRWRGREKNRGKTGLALHRPNLKRVRGILVEFSSWDPPHRRKKVEEIIQKSAGLTRENCSRAPDRIFGPRPRRLRESSIPRAARPKSAHPRSRSQSPYPNEIDGA